MSLNIHYLDLSKTQFAGREDASQWLDDMGFTAKACLVSSRAGYEVYGKGATHLDECQAWLDFPYYDSAQ